MSKSLSLLRPGLLLAAIVFASGCAQLRPVAEAERSWVQVCYPGSAIKRRVPDAAAYPEWMIRERGSCLYH
ncbi:MAG: hypothetical protein HKN58_03355 [Xanthomonadales bacterium]|nr:hypothetical protein [Xanthomonadales bacterium]